MRKSSDRSVVVRSKKKPCRGSKKAMLYTEAKIRWQIREVRTAFRVSPWKFLGIRSKV
jgi:hypothetical protein